MTIHTGSCRWVALTTTALTWTLGASAFGQNYEFDYQRPFGDRADFFVEGPATGNSPDVEGDALLTTVVFPGGQIFRYFYKPVNVSDIQFAGGEDDWSRFRVLGGSRTTLGLNSTYRWGYADGNDEDVSDYDRERFAELALIAFGNNNLNNYVDLGTEEVFSFVIEFDFVVQDNDPEPDEFGEILYFERGTGNGNSWIMMQAVDENGTALGPWLVIGPSETVQTTPRTTVKSITQKVGTTSIDVSRLGVTEFQYLRVSNNVSSQDAYTGGGDRQPDFKIMAVLTNDEQIVEILGTYD